jgi:imidazoleglycerol phosphate dehydratase HisB
MKIKRYNNFLFEMNEIETGEKVDVARFDDIKSEIKEFIEKSINSTDEEMVSDFIDSYVRNPDETEIEGLINDSEVYDFYLKYRNDIDEILSNINFYDEIPSEMNSFSLYDYVIRGTKKAIEEIVSMISQEVQGENPQTEE